uniref:Glutamate decarboxylase like 1 n=1 Tax=Acanthochromis polyacanthus TaxID=80966 RepID=A0A3Q1G4R1_9TELE
VIDDVPLNGPTLDGLAAEEFIHQSMAIIIEDIVKKATDVKEKVCEWRSPDQLKELLDLELRDGGESDSKILQRCRDAIRYSVKTSHPRFFNQLYAGMEPYSMVASFIAEALKPSLYTYEMAPVFTLMEDAVLRKMMELTGWEEGGDGIFNPGGSMSNMYAMNLARYNHSPDIKELGLSAAPRLVVFTSQECHYSITKAAALLGIGTKNVYVVPSDQRGKMIVSALENKIKTAKSENLQLCHSSRASYLFQPDKFYDISYDTGDKSLQCSRKADAFKFWLMWKALGSSQLEERVDRALAMARYLVQEIKKREGFRLLMEPEFANVCFWYIPPSLRNLPDGPELYQKLHTVAPVVKERMMKTGSMMVGYQPHRDKPNFFRMVVISPQVSRQDMDFVLDEIHSLGKDL